MHIFSVVQWKWATLNTGWGRQTFIFLGRQNLKILYYKIEIGTVYHIYFLVFIQEMKSIHRNKEHFELVKVLVVRTFSLCCSEEIRIRYQRICHRNSFLYFKLFLGKIKEKEKVIVIFLNSWWFRTFIIIKTGMWLWSGPNKTFVVNLLK